MNKREMVNVIRRDYGLDSPRVLGAMSSVPREEFVSSEDKSIAYEDMPIPIGFGQTMSQPYTVAFMTHLLTEKRDTKEEKVLEIGTGSGYQAVVLSKLYREVYTIEVIKKLAKNAEKVFSRLGIENVHVKSGSGQWGWRQKAPFDAIMVTAGLGEKVPQELFDQLAVGGVMVAPVGKGYDKKMTKFTKTKSGKVKKEKHGTFHFVPFVEEKN